MLKVLDLFSGIGGFSLGLERTGGFKTVAFCEIEKFPQQVLKKHWPDVPIYEDVRNVTREQLAADGIFPNVITGGFPCQDISVAGNQKGINSETRSGLWSECARLLGDIRPDYAIFENVTALISGDNGRWFQRVLFDISAVGYDAEWHCIPASELGAHHHRDRVWIIAYPSLNGSRRASDETSGKTERQNGVETEQSTEHGEIQPMAHANSLKQSISIDGGKFKGGGKAASEGAEPLGSGSSMAGVLPNSDVADSSGNRLQGCGEKGAVKGSSRLCDRERWNKIKNLSDAGIFWSTEPDVGRVADGIPDRTHRLKGLGNAVVPQIPELIGRAILESQNAR